MARFAWSVVMFNIVVIAAGVLVRATGSGAGCGRSWPTCQGELVPELSGATTIEFTHRALSGIALVAVFVLAVMVFRRTSPGAPARLGAVLSAIAIVVEALIGAAIVLSEWVAGDASLARAIAVPLHLVNTLFLLAALTLTAYWLSGGGPLRAPRDRSVLWAIALAGTALVLISASGAVTALADTLFPKSGEGITGSGEAADLLTRLRLAHPVLAIGAAAAAWWVAGRSGPPRSAAGRWIWVLVGVLLISGAVNVALGVPVWMQLVHVVLADALWISYVLVSARAMDPGRHPARVAGP